jgi:pSer/pThr/pTyr-binding forkhead associated (FHA) protein
MPANDTRPIERNRIADFADVKDLSTDDFAAKFPDPVLIVAPPKEGDEEEGREDLITGTTVTFSVGAQLKAAREQYLVFFIKKKPTTFGNAIWVGRASNCDVVLPFNVVSKVHAKLTLEPNGEFRIGDAGSLNGTSVEGARLAKGKMIPLGDGAKITLGSVEVRFCLPKGFHHELKLFWR